jgi:hypothetical protein
VSPPVPPAAINAAQAKAAARRAPPRTFFLENCKATPSEPWESQTVPEKVAAPGPVDPAWGNVSFGSTRERNDGVLFNDLDEGSHGVPGAGSGHRLP